MTSAVPLTIGVELPLRGDIGADGLSALEGMTDEIRRYNSRPNVRHLSIVVKDSTLGGYANPHQDEGTDATVLPPQASAIARDFAKDSSVIAVIGGLQTPIAIADADVARATNLPLIVLAPLPDDCAAVRTRLKTRAPAAISVAGADSLEALAVARFVKGRFQTLGIMSERAVKPRAAQASCFISALAHQEVTSEAQIAQLALTSDFATLKRRAASGALDGFVYFGPALRGALVCDRAGVVALPPSTLTAAAHRGYDSTTVPKNCQWLRRRDDPALAARSAVKALIRALTAESRRHNGDVGKVSRQDLRAEFRDSGASGAAPGSKMRDCSGGSADRTTFERVPRRTNQAVTFSIESSRCAS